MDSVQVLAWEQVREVSRALTWVFDNAEHYGGDPYRVTLMGHSAGMQISGKLGMLDAASIVLRSRDIK